MEGQLGRKIGEVLTHTNHRGAETNDRTAISGDADREIPGTTAAFPKTTTPIQSSMESVIILSHHVSLLSSTILYFQPN